MMNRLMILFTMVLTLLCVVKCQDCIDSGHKCEDHGQCCGGCCFSGICIDTYRPCTDLSNPCQSHYCPPGLECIPFKPDHCPECEIYAICQ